MDSVTFERRFIVELVKTMTAVFAAVIVSISIVGQSFAQSPPPLPNIYFGNVTADGSPVPDGFTIHGQVGEYVSQSVTINDSKYQGLIVGPPNASFVGSEIVFLLGDIPANEKDVFQPGELPVVKSNFDLTFSNLPGLTPTPVPSTSTTMLTVLGISMLLLSLLMMRRRLA
jgi:hypothetical protein